MAASPPSSASPNSTNTTATTPPSAPSPVPATTTSNDLSDIWGSDSDSPPSPRPTAQPLSLNQPPEPSSQTNPNPSVFPADSPSLLSDIPSLRRQHITSGYREGLSIGKARVMQDGFDAGFPLGVEIALRVGRILGVLEGVVQGLRMREQERGKGEGFDDRVESNMLDSSRETMETQGPFPPTLETSQDRAPPQRTRPRQSSFQQPPPSLSQISTLLRTAQKELSIKALLESLQEDDLANADSLRGLGGIEGVLRRWEEVVGLEGIV